MIQSIGREGQDLARQMLKYSPAMRLSAKEVGTSLDGAEAYDRRYITPSLLPFRGQHRPYTSQSLWRNCDPVHSLPMKPKANPFSPIQPSAKRNLQACRQESGALQESFSHEAYKCMYVVLSVFLNTVMPE